MPSRKEKKHKLREQKRSFRSLVSKKAYAAWAIHLNILRKIPSRGFPDPARVGLRIPRFTRSRNKWLVQHLLLELEKPQFAELKERLLSGAHPNFVRSLWPPGLHATDSPRSLNFFTVDAACIVRWARHYRLVDEAGHVIRMEFTTDTEQMYLRIRLTEIQHSSSLAAAFMNRDQKLVQPLGTFSIRDLSSFLSDKFVQATVKH